MFSHRGSVKSRCSSGVEQLIRNEQVVGSNPTSGSTSGGILLVDISVGVDVTVFDDGRHSAPAVFVNPFRAGLVFVPGALLRSGGPAKPADW